MMIDEVDMQKIVDDCYKGYLIFADNPLPKEEWIKLPEAKRFINKMNRTHKNNKKRGR